VPVDLGLLDPENGGGLAVDISFLGVTEAEIRLWNVSYLSRPTYLHIAGLLAAILNFLLPLTMYSNTI